MMIGSGFGGAATPGLPLAKHAERRRSRTVMKARYDDASW